MAGLARGHGAARPTSPRGTSKFSARSRSRSTLTWEELSALPQTGDHGRHPLRHALEPVRHELRGVHWRELAKLVRPKPSARFVLAHAEQGFTANVPLAALEDDNAMVA